MPQRLQLPIFAASQTHDIRAGSGHSVLVQCATKGDMSFALKLRNTMPLIASCHCQTSQLAYTPDSAITAEQHCVKTLPIAMLACYS